MAPHIARDYVYVDDVVRAYLLAATEEKQELGAVYNVGTGVQTSLREVVDVACRTLGIAEEPKWGSMDNRIWDTGHVGLEQPVSSNKNWVGILNTRSSRAFSKWYNGSRTSRP